MSRILSRKNIRRTRVIVLIILAFWTSLWIVNILKKGIPDQPLSSQQKIFIAANFYNNEDILYNFNEQLLKLIQMLGPKNVYVSIFENGSKDKTKSLLYALQFLLDYLGVANRIVVSNMSKTFDRRINYMADLRNKVLEPLLTLNEISNDNNTDYNTDNNIKFDKIIYFNDIIWTTSDILTLLRTNDYNYDAVCAMDFYWTFYDTFATRELPLSFLSSYSSSSSSSSKQSSLNTSNGYSWRPLPYYPYFYNTTLQQQFYNDDPAQVFSCWNGVIIMNAEPFVKHNVRFRSLMPFVEKLSFDASECCLVHSDFRRLGYDKIFINPNVRVAYKYRFYFWSNYILPILDKSFFRYFNHLTPPSIFSNEGLRMQSIMENASKYNISELDKICIQ